ncbi:hypothetical protein AvCA_18180 [Azotobacter vinelandii CA]|uniref:Uncharacterized protein n=2 Tax=Azotobacter vinelandii TaxID=354 RepID=C1DDR0_AZOVD|nr:hypothetical protein [Azotobacter vinelandii]ACO78031.1 conserved hypothetical protein [Azotobacter vinelandii DJ]AGK15165.1 hypothetical protein AvCA_18180 [Azotobacter vinelandii CA]AGK20187.1 hypothetical protein AvCA6_18180 [Azotobacter vinelandii CA6]WKN23749.1 hypothetical protein AVAEIV_001857 [Azotobacter vinelandii]SFX91277.1 hypothetical protein SAMN04244547_03197 [Azotobacter vinelandii]
MARKHFAKFDAISSAVPVDDVFEAVIAVKRRGVDENARVHKVANGQRYDLASEADAAAEAALSKVVEVRDDGELLWEPHAL